MTRPLPQTHRSHRLARNIALLLLLSAVAWLTGCVTKRDVARDVAQRRQTAYQQIISPTADPNQPALVETITGPLSILHALELAQHHNKDIQSARARLLEARGQLLEAGI